MEAHTYIFVIYSPTAGPAQGRNHRIADLLPASQDSFLWTHRICGLLWKRPPAFYFYSSSWVDRQLSHECHPYLLLRNIGWIWISPSNTFSSPRDSLQEFNLNSRYFLKPAPLCTGDRSDHSKDATQSHLPKVWYVHSATCLNSSPCPEACLCESSHQNSMTKMFE